jgi:hypothetical protein
MVPTSAAVGPDHRGWLKICTPAKIVASPVKTIKIGTMFHYSVLNTGSA